MLGTGVISGSYPALYLSKFQPSSILRGKFHSGKEGSFIRNILVVLQFSVSIILIVCTLIVGAQLDFMRNKDLGFGKEEIVVVNVQDPKIIENPLPLKNTLIQDSRILDILVTCDLPTTIRSNSTFKKPEWGGENARDFFYINWGWVGHNFFDFFGIELVEGRLFSPDYPTDKGAFIINETAARAIDWEDPLGKRIREKEVIGVVKDFHFHPLRVEIEPVALTMNEAGQIRCFALKIDTQDIRETLAYIERTWKRFSPGYPYTVTFFDESVDRMYNSEKRLLKIFNSFAALAIVISCLGLFGLALFAAERRTKEIGIRKVLGASSLQILFLFSKEFTLWVILANLIAWPVSYLAMKKWLNSFACRTDIEITTFALAGVLALAIALITVGYHAAKSVIVDPVTSLRYE